MNHRSVNENLRLRKMGEDGGLAIHIGRAKVAAGDQLFFKYSQPDEPYP